jgi:hypothetical protein
VTKVLAPVFLRKGAKRTLSLSPTTPPKNPRTPRREPRSPSTVARAAAPPTDADANADDNVGAAPTDKGVHIHSPPTKKARAARRCCDCTNGMCVYGGGPKGGKNGCPCRGGSSRPCELSCARPDCQNQGSQSAPPDSTAELFWTAKLCDAEMMAKTLHGPIDAANGLFCYPISVGSGKSATTQQRSPSPIRGGVSLLPAAAISMITPEHIWMVASWTTSSSKNTGVT